jgi:hypothetical protein
MASTTRTRSPSRAPQVVPNRLPIPRPSLRASPAACPQGWIANPTTVAASRAAARATRPSVDAALTKTSSAPMASPTAAARWCAPMAFALSVGPNETCSDSPECCSGNCTNQHCSPGNSPIIIDVDGSGFNLTDYADGVKFDFFDTGQAIQLSWTARAP